MRRVSCLLANFNAFAYDFIARQKVGGVHLSYFIVEQLPILPPETYAEKCPWSKEETLEQWISERVLKLTCTAKDMLPLAKACDFKGSRGDGVHIWKEAERAEIRAELDAAYFHLYGICATTPSTFFPRSPIPDSCPKTNVEPSNSCTLPEVRAKWCSMRWVAWTRSDEHESREHAHGQRPKTCPANLLTSSPSSRIAVRPQSGCRA